MFQCFINENDIKHSHLGTANLRIFENSTFENLKFTYIMKPIHDGQN